MEGWYYDRKIVQKSRNYVLLVQVDMRRKLKEARANYLVFFFVVVVGSEKKKWIALISYWVPISTECQKKGEQACAVAANSG